MLRLILIGMLQDKYVLSLTVARMLVIARSVLTSCLFSVWKVRAEPLPLTVNKFSFAVKVRFRKGRLNGVTCVKSSIISALKWPVKTWPGCSRMLIVGITKGIDLWFRHMVISSMALANMC